jgi:predicted DNA-binding ribbon-helix-helix protein
VEVIRLRAELDDTRLDRANLLAAARATIGAYLDGESDPLCYLRDELAVRGQLPPNEGGYS